MKKKLITGCLLTALAFSMIGCGKKTETNAPAKVDETFQEDAKDTQDDTTKEDTSATNTQEEPANDEAVVNELKSLSAYESVIYAMYQPDISKDGVAYVPSDPQFYWLTVCFAVNNFGSNVDGISYDESTGIYTVPADKIPAYARTCFGTTQSVPDIPSEVSYVKKVDSNYQITAGDMGDMSFELTKAYKNSDGTYTGFVELGTSEGTLGTYKLTFQADNNEDALCPYDVTDAVLVK